MTIRILALASLLLAAGMVARAEAQAGCTNATPAAPLGTRSLGLPLAPQRGPGMTMRGAASFDDTLWRRNDCAPSRGGAGPVAASLAGAGAGATGARDASTAASADASGSAFFARMVAARGTATRPPAASEADLAP